MNGTGAPGRWFVLPVLVAIVLGVASAVWLYGALIAG